MTGNDANSSSRTRDLAFGRFKHLRHAAILGAVLASLAIVAAACSSSPSPGANGSGSTSGPEAKALAYTQCMRQHGISDYPDPPPSSGGSGGGGVSVPSGQGGANSDLSPNNPTFQAAGQACKSNLPAGAQPSSPGENTAGVKLANCLRSHGFPSFPDPNGQNVFTITGIDQNSSQYQSAFHTCQEQSQDHGALFRYVTSNAPPGVTTPPGVGSGG